MGTLPNTCSIVKHNRRSPFGQQAIANAPRYREPASEACAELIDHAGEVVDPELHLIVEVTGPTLMRDLAEIRVVQDERPSREEFRLRLPLGADRFRIRVAPRSPGHHVEVDGDSVLASFDGGVLGCQQRVGRGEVLDGASLRPMSSAKTPVAMTLSMPESRIAPAARNLRMSNLPGWMPPTSFAGGAAAGVAPLTTRLRSREHRVGEFLRFGSHKLDTRSNPVATGQRRG